MDHVGVEIPVSKIQDRYENWKIKLEKIRSLVQKPLTLTEKILFTHLDSLEGLNEIKRGKSFLMLRCDRVCMQDATAQMALLQFMQSLRHEVAVPTTVHCDHLIIAHRGVEHDMQVASQENKEVFEFLQSASSRYGIGFWGPGAGIIHQVVLENYAFPGGLMVGTDSHTPNAGGLGMLAVGVGGADAVDVMAGLSWELLCPRVIAVVLTGQLMSWTAPKDVILRVLELLTVKGGTNCIIEYIGPGARSLSATGMATITNMGAELGATTSVFPHSASMSRYLHATNRGDLADLADQCTQLLTPDPEVEKNPQSFYDQVLEIDLSTLEPYIVGPHSPDLARPVSKMREDASKNGYPTDLKVCLVGSCTNSSYEDISRAAGIAKQALNQGLKAKVPLMISPGSMKVFATIKRDGLLQTLEDFGGVVLANACGPCIGQWKRDDIEDGQVNSILTSFNRNFRGRNDSNHETLGFIGSPEIVVAAAISGDLGFNPAKDTFVTPSGEHVTLKIGDRLELPPNGFVDDRTGYQEPSHSQSTAVVVDKNSERIQLLEPFSQWDGQDFKDLLILMKVKGKCTTDHISPAGRWLRFRGHLDNISDNMLLGANHIDPGFKPGHGKNQLTGAMNEPVAAIARDYQKKNHPWVIIGDENYGEGSSREHAAMSPRYLGALAVLVKSFARIHETNLKKQGLLALTFQKPEDYDLIESEDRLDILGLTHFAPQKPLEILLTHKDGSKKSFKVNHSYNREQILWFKAGSCLAALIQAENQLS